MTRKEALDFLELSEKATNYEIKQRLVDKLAYYEHLSENAPSDFLRKINIRHVTKVKDIQREYPEWDPKNPEVSIEIPPDNADIELLKEQKESEPLTTPIIVFSGNKTGINSPKKTFPDPPGWLIRHTEHQPSKTFTLSGGKNYIGRKADPSLNPFIIIDEDLFVSKVHAVIIVEAVDNLDFYIEDTPEANGGKASKNGTFINGDESRVCEKIKLSEGDTIQVGLTKLILKINKNKIEDIIQEVKRSKFMHTVVINKM